MAARPKIVKGATKFLSGNLDTSDDEPLQNRSESKRLQQSFGKKLIQGSTASFDSNEEVDGVRRKRPQLVKGSTGMLDDGEDEEEEFGFGRQLSQDSVASTGSGRGRLIKGATQYLDDLLNGETDDEDDSNAKEGVDHEGAQKSQNGVSQDLPRQASDESVKGRRMKNSGARLEIPLPQKRAEAMKTAVRFAGAKGAKKLKHAVRFAAADHEEAGDEDGDRSPTKDEGEEWKFDEWLLRLGAEVLGEGCSLDTDLDELLVAAQNRSRECRDQAKRAEEYESKMKVIEMETVKLRDTVHTLEQQRNDALSRATDPAEQAMNMETLRKQMDKLTRDNKRLSGELRQQRSSAQTEVRETSPKAAPMMSKGMHDMHMNSSREQIDVLTKENNKLSREVARFLELESTLAEKQREIERMHALYEKLGNYLSERVVLDGSNLEDRIPLLVDEFLEARVQLEEQTTELHKLRKKSAVLQRLPDIQQQVDKKCADLDEQIDLFQRVSHAFPVTSIEPESPRSEALATPGFAPIVSIYDCEEECGGLTRIIQIQAPGRHVVENGSSSVNVDLQPLPNGVSVKLFREATIPDTAQIGPLFAPFEAGTWEWRYEPTDGVWNISKYWGLEHGVLALSMTQVPLSASLSKGVVAENGLVAVDLSRKSVRKRTKRGTLDMPVKKIQLLRDTTLISEDGLVVQAASLFAGQRVKGPRGFAEVTSIRRMPKQEHRLLSLCMGLETLTVLPGQTTCAFRITEDGAAAFDYHESIFGDLQAGANELLLQNMCGVEQNVLLTEVRRKKREAVLLEIAFISPGGGLLVAPTPNAKQTFVTLLGKRGGASVAKKGGVKNLSAQAPIFSPRRVGVSQWH